MSVVAKVGRRALIGGLVLTAVIGALATSAPRPALAGSRDDLAAEVGSYDLAVGPPARFITGVFTADHRYVGWGTVRMRFFFLGSQRATTRSPQPVASMTRAATFLAVPGVSIRREPRTPTVLSASKGRGVYATEVGFDRAGIWQVQIRARVNGGGLRRTTAAFEVLAQHQVPAPGDPALATEHVTLSSPGVAAASLDSRATGGQVPDPVLHRTSIVDALGAHRPVVVVFSTPAFCTSRMCGPITDMIEDLARDYSDRASFVHIEIWKNFDRQQVNDAASAWLAAHGNDLREPWVFLIGADSRITARWDNVASRGEIEPLLRQLPTLAPSSPAGS